jgi:hypothetical protein
MGLNVLITTRGVSMFKRFILAPVVCAAIASSAYAQNQRRASFMGGGGPDRGKCTVEVVVDTAADVEIRGDNANLRTIAGQPAQWRRFECTGPLPSNPAAFRFEGIDGRGRQSLFRDPRNGGAAVIRIEDSGGVGETGLDREAGLAATATGEMADLIAAAVLGGDSQRSKPSKYARLPSGNRPSAGSEIRTSISAEPLWTTTPDARIGFWADSMYAGPAGTRRTAIPAQ